jgi:hypothetical protein
MGFVDLPVAVGQCSGVIYYVIPQPLVHTCLDTYGMLGVVISLARFCGVLLTWARVLPRS